MGDITGNATAATDEVDGVPAGPYYADGTFMANGTIKANGGLIWDRVDATPYVSTDNIDG